MQSVCVNLTAHGASCRCRRRITPFPEHFRALRLYTLTHSTPVRLLWQRFRYTRTQPQSAPALRYSSATSTAGLSTLTASDSAPHVVTLLPPISTASMCRHGSGERYTDSMGPHNPMAIYRTSFVISQAGQVGKTVLCGAHPNNRTTYRAVFGGHIK
jgi:hypothetical protein